ncbi:ribose 5-phosphate isomerase B [Arenibacter nanhaiticus]|uniref:Ribose 5-phosphate isomerase B n=1 Tax=Arenibacter nanhaiticus TaxID=558155 RepID=A0A1M6MWP2_9FLAO|nr:RpiB/LacA/LacB family sugar-phosphate isomerase [Arenibacter nanhaiticus]SHJ87901.1 ribose 5-phosphate isomerase B [Arenibacter nanhaiticus]
MKIAIGNDHAGTAYKHAIVELLNSMNIEVTNYGTDQSESVDYADFVHPVSKDVTAGIADLGIIICGSGNGACMTANKHQKVRAALCWTTEIVKLAKEHNDANVLGIPARYVSLPQALDMVATFINTAFEGGRHQNRIEKIPCV